MWIHEDEVIVFVDSTKPIAMRGDGGLWYTRSTG